MGCYPSDINLPEFSLLLSWQTICLVFGLPTVLVFCLQEKRQSFVMSSLSAAFKPFPIFFCSFIHRKCWWYRRELTWNGKSWDLRLLILNIWCTCILLWDNSGITGKLFVNRFSHFSTKLFLFLINSFPQNNHKNKMIFCDKKIRTERIKILFLPVYVIKLLVHVFRLSKK